MGDDIPRPVSTLTNIPAMGVTQNAAVAGNSGEVERQIQTAEYELQQQQNIFSQQVELVRHKYCTDAT